MKKLRVAMLVHWSLVPPEDLTGNDDPRIEKFQSEHDVKNALLALGHEVKVVGVYDELAPIRGVIEGWKPHIVFNLLEDFAGNSALDYYVVTYLEMLGVAYTGCNPRGLLLGRDKALSKKLLRHHHIDVPDFMVFPCRRKIGRLRKLAFPVIVKSLIEEGSVGIAQASHCESEIQLRERVSAMHQMTKGDVIAEQYIHGREFYVTVLGNKRLEVLPVRELVFDKLDADMPKMATYNVKFNAQYRKRWGIDYIFARTLPAGVSERISRLCKRVYRVLDLSGYARIDLRLTPSGDLYVLEANPNPAISDNDECAFAAEKHGMSYPQFIQHLVGLGLAAHRSR